VPCRIRRRAQRRRRRSLISGRLRLLRRWWRRRLRLQRRRPAELYLAGDGPGTALRQRQHAGRRTQVSARCPIRDRPDDVTGAYPIDIDGEASPTLPCSATARTCSCVAGHCASRARTSGGASPVATMVDGVQRESGTAARHGRTIAIGNYLGPAGANGVSRASMTVFRLGASAATFGPPTSLTPSWCTLSLLFTTGRSGRRDLRVSNDRHYYGEASAGRSSCGAFRRPARHPVHRRGRLGSPCACGMGIATTTFNGDGYPITS